MKNAKKTFYPATCEEAMVNRKGEIASREAGEKSLYVTRPSAGIEEIIIAGLIM